MNKRIVSFCAAASVALSCTAAAFAAPVSQLKDLITMLPNYETSFQSVQLSVPADIELREGDTGEYADGPVTKEITSTNVAVTFSYKATLLMQSVRDQFTEYWTDAKALISAAKLADAAVDTDDLLEQLNNVPVSGNFAIEVKFPQSMTIPESVKNGGNMEGFNDEAKKVFKEVGTRTVNNNGITINIAVKGPNDADPKDYVTGAELYDNGNLTYLPDIEFTCDNVAIKGAGSHRVTASLLGTIKIGDADAPITTVRYTAVQDTTDDGDKNRLPADGIYETVTLNEIYSGPTGGGGGGSTINRPTATATPAPVSTIQPAEPESDAELNTEDHYAYIIGDDNGLVRPMDSISRAEVATIFYRMFTDETREKYFTTSNDFSDVNEGEWYNVAVSTLANAKVLTGYDDGTFKPSAPITRAELAAIVSRITDGIYKGYDLFNDIKNNWAKEYINRAAYKGWIQGDGTNYRPDENITRAETMTLINNVLVRHVEVSGMYEDMNIWPDNQPGTWYYTAVQEATNSHKYERIENSEYEKWTEAMADRDWAALEKVWAEKND